MKFLSLIIALFLSFNAAAVNTCGDCNPPPPPPPPVEVDHDHDEHDHMHHQHGHGHKHGHSKHHGKH